MKYVPSAVVIKSISKDCFLLAVIKWLGRGCHCIEVGKKSVGNSAITAECAFPLSKYQHISKWSSLEEEKEKETETIITNEIECFDN